jgi:hypothetical protein
MIAALRGSARALRRSAALLLAWETGLVLTVLVSSWFGKAAFARFDAEIRGVPAPEPPYPVWLPGLLAPLGAAVFVLYPAALAGAWLALPAGLRRVKLYAGSAYAAVIVIVFTGLVLGVLDSVVLLGVYAAVFPPAFVILPQLFALECWKRSERGASILWQAVTFGALLPLLDEWGLIFALYLVLRFGALAWTVWIGGLPVATLATPPRVRDARALG